MTQIVYPGSSMLFNHEVRNQDTGAWIDDATVTVTVTDSTGAEVSGGNTWPATLAYKTGSKGIYQVTLQRTLAFVAGSAYTATVTAIGDSLYSVEYVAITAKTRR